MTSCTDTSVSWLFRGIIASRTHQAEVESFIVIGTPATIRTTLSAISAILWFIWPKKSRYIRPLRYAGTIPLPTSLVTATTEAFEARIASETVSMCFLRIALRILLYSHNDIRHVEREAIYENHVCLL